MLLLLFRSMLWSVLFMISWLARAAHCALSAYVFMYQFLRRVNEGWFVVIVIMLHQHDTEFNLCC